MSYVVIALSILGLTIWAVVSFIEWLGKKTNEVKARLAVDTRKNIIERNQEIIQRRFQQIHDSNRSYYAENQVKDCIGEIANREGRTELIPKYREWLSVWERRSDIPLEYQELKKYLISTFESRINEVKIERQQADAAREHDRKELIAREGQQLFERNKDLIGKFLEIAERKVSVIDDYGDENWEVLPDEILACMKKVAQREGFYIDWEAYGKAKRKGNFNYGSGCLPDEYYSLRLKLEEAFKEYHEKHKLQSPKTADLNDLSGVEFETLIARLLKMHGYDDVRGTPATGDQGADLIAKKDGKTIIIQAKRYQGTVGNKAVQEVLSAVGFYGGDEGWVITNSRFTASAKSLANKTKIRLIDGLDLERLAGRKNILGDDLDGSYHVKEI